MVMEQQDLQGLPSARSSLRDCSQRQRQKQREREREREMKEGERERDERRREREREREEREAETETETETRQRERERERETDRERRGDSDGENKNPSLVVQHRFQSRRMSCYKSGGGWDFRFRSGVRQVSALTASSRESAESLILSRSLAGCEPWLPFPGRALSDDMRISEDWRWESQLCEGVSFTG